MRMFDLFVFSSILQFSSLFGTVLLNESSVRNDLLVMICSLCLLLHHFQYGRTNPSFLNLCDWILTFVDLGEFHALSEPFHFFLVKSQK